jgi:hypothetical protein
MYCEQSTHMISSNAETVRDALSRINQTVDVVRVTVTAYM